tara:strand:- start:112 stop:369 length:258 start_codon:yes stop_codon:yes gene_type:complete
MSKYSEFISSYDGWFEYQKYEGILPGELPYERKEFPAELMEVPTSMEPYKVLEPEKKKVTLHDVLYALATRYEFRGGSENVTPYS